MAIEKGRVRIIARTLEVWQPRTARALTREDAREMVDNVVRFVRLVCEWEQAARSATPPAAGPPTQ